MLLVEGQMITNQSRSLHRLAFGSIYRPGIDVAVVVAILSAALDLVSLLLPWLVGIVSVYVEGQGLTHVVAVNLSGFDLFSVSPYLVIVIVPILLTIILTYLSVHPEGIIPPRVTYKTKSRILLMLAVFTSMAPSFIFLQYFANAIYITTPQVGVPVSSWELGAGSTMPTYAGLGFIFALVLKIIKD
jgi:hypothetical protein